jgi:hypothetical protein
LTHLPLHQWPPWSYGRWIYHYLCNQCISPLKLWVRIPFMRGVLDTTLFDKVCQWLVGGFLRGTPVSSTNKTDRQHIAEISLKVALNIITLTPDTLTMEVIEVGRNYSKFVRSSCPIFHYHSSLMRKKHHLQENVLIQLSNRAEISKNK